MAGGVVPYPRRRGELLGSVFSDDGGSSPSLIFDAASGTLPQGFTITRASNATYFDSAGVLQTATSNVARFDYDPATLAFKGLLIEEQRTNVQSNPRFEGASASPSTFPTPFGFFINTGLSYSVAGTGTEYGMSYLDMRISGVTTAASGDNVYLLNATPTSPSVTWTGSIYARQVGGSKSNLTAINLRFIELNAGAGYLSETATDIMTTLSASLKRYVVTYTLGASAGNTRISIAVGTGAVGVPVDLTMRIYAPQHELGSFATSPILPPVGSPAASTRNSDLIANNPIGSWYNANQGTMVVRASPLWPALPTGYQQRFWAAANGTGTVHNMQSYISSNTITTNVWYSGGSVALLQPATTWPGTKSHAFAYSTDDFASTVNGGTVATDAAGGVPVGIDRFYLGAGSDGASWTWNGHIQSFIYYPNRLSNTQMQAITA